MSVDTGCRCDVSLAYLISLLSLCFQIIRLKAESDAVLLCVRQEKAVLSAEAKTMKKQQIHRSLSLLLRSCSHQSVAPLTTVMCYMCGNVTIFFSFFFLVCCIHDHLLTSHFNAIFFLVLCAQPQ